MFILQNLAELRGVLMTYSSKLLKCVQEKARTPTAAEGGE